MGITIVAMTHKIPKIQNMLYSCTSASNCGNTRVRMNPESQKDSKPSPAPAPLDFYGYISEEVIMATVPQLTEYPMLYITKQTVPIHLVVTVSK